MSQDDFYNSPFPPRWDRTSVPTPDLRLAGAAEYGAHQLFQIRKLLERIADALEKK